MSKNPHSTSPSSAIVVGTVLLVALVLEVASGDIMPLVIAAVGIAVWTLTRRDEAALKTEDLLTVLHSHDQTASPHAR